MHYKLGVMGNPILHSRSPWVHQQFAKQFNLSLEYSKIQPEINGFEERVEQFKNDNGYGLNVTHPFKQEAFALATTLSDRAKLAKTVNTLIFTKTGEIYGDNTDGVGFINDVVRNNQFSLKDKTIVIIGAGGAVRGILLPLLSGKPANVILVNRTLAKAQSLVAEYNCYGNITAASAQDLTNLKVDMLIDSTAFGSEWTLPASLQMQSNGFCYDLKYGSTASVLMKWAQAKTCAFSSGIGMLVEQAAESFHLWTGHRPQTHDILKQLQHQELETTLFIR